MQQRTLTKTIKEISKSFPVLLLTGPRQVGKTTLFEMCSTQKMQYVTLDDLDARQMAQNDPGAFYSNLQNSVNH
jgi:predicted AAA+ superfamily ATPase